LVIGFFILLRYYGAFKIVEKKIILILLNSNPLFRFTY